MVYRSGRRVRNRARPGDPGARLTRIKLAAGSSHLELKAKAFLTRMQAALERLGLKADPLDELVQRMGPNQVQARVLRLDEVGNLEHARKKRHADDVFACRLVIALGLRRRVVQQPLGSIQSRAGVFRFKSNHDPRLQRDEQVDLPAIDDAFTVEVWKGGVMTRL